MVWRRTWTGLALVAAACGGQSLERMTDRDGGDAGDAGDPTAPPSGEGGTSVGGAGAPNPMPTAGSGGTAASGAAGRPGGRGGATQQGGHGGDEPAPHAGSGGEPTGSGGTDPIDPDAGEGGGGGAREIPNCPLVSATTTDNGSPTGQCVGIYGCDAEGIQYDVICEGQDDGTKTSICDCHYDGVTWRLDARVLGLAPRSCNNAALSCLTTWPDN